MIQCYLVVFTFSYCLGWIKTKISCFIQDDFSTIFSSVTASMWGSFSAFRRTLQNWWADFSPKFCFKIETAAVGHHFWLQKDCTWQRNWVVRCEGEYFLVYTASWRQRRLKMTLHDIERLKRRSWPHREICSCFWLVVLLALVHGSSS